MTLAWHGHPRFASLPLWLAVIGSGAYVEPEKSEAARLLGIYR